MPVYDLQSLAGEVLAYSEITATLQNLPHEGGHREDIARRKHNRHDRMASEMIANYEGFNWQVRNTTNNLYEVSRRLGENFSIFLRSKGEYNYFQRTSERLVREFFKTH
jgi:hypothetical protein